MLFTPFDRGHGEVVLSVVFPLNTFYPAKQVNGFRVFIGLHGEQKSCDFVKVEEYNLSVALPISTRT